MNSSTNSTVNTNKTHRIDLFMQRLGRYFKETAAHFNQDRGFILASSMVYSTLFSIVPFFAFITILLSQSKYINLELIQNWIDEKVLPLIVPDIQGNFIHLLESFIDNASTFSWISFIISLLSATLLVKKINDSFNFIYSATPRRKMVTRIASYIPAIIIGSFILGFAFTLMQPIFSWFADLDILSTSRFHFFITSKLLPWLLFVAILLLIFKTTPSTYVQWSSAYLATFTTTIGWLFTNWIFTKVISAVFNFEKIYGSLASIFFFLLWIYVLWIILFFALEMAYVHQYRGNLHHDTPSRQLATAFNLLLYLQKEATINAGPISLKKMTRELSLPSSQLQEQIGLLQDQGFIVQKRKFFPTYELAADFRERPIADLLQIELGKSSTDEGGQLATLVFEAVKKQNDQKTIGDLLSSLGRIDSEIDAQAK